MQKSIPQEDENVKHEKGLHEKLSQENKEKSNPETPALPQTQDIQFSVVTATNPKRLNKKFYLDEQGNLQKESGGVLIEGFLETKQAANIQEVAKILDSLTSSQAVIWGICPYQKCHIVTKANLEKFKTNNPGVPVITRTREFFSYPEGAAIFPIDYDPLEGENPLSDEELLGIFYKLIPGLENAPHLIRPSASSFIYQGEQELKGAGGKRILVVVKNGKDIPRLAKILFKKTWLHGYGRIKISKSGAILVQSILMDASIYQPERLDFVGEVECIAR